MGGETTMPIRAAKSYPKYADHPIGKLILPIYTDRLNQFSSSGQWEKQNLLSKLYEGKASGDEWVKLEVYSPPDLARPPFKDIVDKKFKSTHVGESFGPSWSTHWFKITLTVPKELLKKELLEFHWDANNEGLIWTEDGQVVHGLTGGGERPEWILPKSYTDGKPHVFYIEMACNHMFGNAGGDTIQPPSPDRYYQLWKAEIVAVNSQARKLKTDFWIIGDAAKEFPGDSWESHKALEICNRIMDTFYAGEGSPETIDECRKIAEEYVGELVNSSKIYDGDQPSLITAVGNCHIDTCWLWPWAETKRKVARSWSNQLDLIERYPEYRFVCSQAQQWKWLEMYYPDLFDRVKAAVKKGTFIPIGGSWVEHDTNMPSGESLVRQFIYGQRFFESRFGKRCETFWLPDTFGYSSQIPQICRLAGMTRFFTQKLSWNNVNNFPHTTFNWVSLDGSQVLCHMTPAETYTANADFGDVKRCMTQHKSLDQDNTSLLVYGKGDGGGGATWEQIEKLRRERGISDTVGLLPRVTSGGTVDDYFAKIEKRVENGLELTNWYGELYFEFHRGTYTTQANNKRNNRQSEFLLRTAEYLSTLASIKDVVDEAKNGGNGKDSKPFKYPKKDIDFMWEAVLLCQFHDCLPGSSIEMCYDDSDKLYKEVFERGEDVISTALTKLGFDKTKNKALPEMAINILPWDRCEIVKSVDDVTGLSYESIAICDQVKSRYRPGFRTAEVQELSDGVFEMSNTRLTVKVDNGVITSLYDTVAKRETITKGKAANQFVIFDDKPLYWQAWDVEVYHLGSRKPLTTTKTYLGACSPYSVSVVTEAKISKDSWLKSTIKLDAYVDETLPAQVSIETEVEWRETMKFLKVEFPVDVHNTEASYETQYGITRRPTHYNTSWDMAKFEVCCHKWADLSESNYGVSILNDSKYGFATAGNLMRLSLLRAPKAPDAHADMGHHVIRYAILPHSGPLDHRTIRAGYNLNSPPRLVRHPDFQSVSHLLALFRITGAPNLIVDTVKRGDDDEDVSVDNLPKRKGTSIVVRLFDSLGGKSTGQLYWGDVPVKKVFRTNVLEDDGEELTIEDKSIEITVKAFEVVTLRLQL